MCVAHVSVCNGAFITSTCFMLISLTVDIKEGIHSLKEGVINDTNRLELLDQFIELLDFQSEARQLSELIEK